MAFTTSYPQAARRHLRAAEKLFDGDRSQKVEAGYLYGLAAECALKKLAGHSSVGRRHPVADRDDPFKAHFPRLKTLLRDALQGRHSQEWRHYVENDSFMREWDVAIRYAPSEEINQGWIARWKEQAREIVDAMSL
jgi:hypothetical protein